MGRTGMKNGFGYRNGGMMAAVSAIHDVQPSQRIVFLMPTLLLLVSFLAGRF